MADENSYDSWIEHKDLYFTDETNPWYFNKIQKPINIQINPTNTKLEKNKSKNCYEIYIICFIFSVICIITILKKYK